MEVATEYTGRASKETMRVARHRKKVATSGEKRVEVTVSARDAPLVKALAGVLRSGGEDAERIRESLQPLIPTARARTGEELVAFFRTSPLVENEFEVERDRSTGRAADLG